MRHRTPRVKGDDVHAHAKKLTPSGASERRPILFDGTTTTDWNPDYHHRTCTKQLLNHHVLSE
jgi:hypothetical protein